MYEYIMSNKTSFEGKLLKLLISIKDCNRYLKLVVSKDIEFEIMLLQIMKILKDD